MFVFETLAAWARALLEVMLSGTWAVMRYLWDLFSPLFLGFWDDMWLELPQNSPVPQQTWNKAFYYANYANLWVPVDLAIVLLGALMGLKGLHLVIVWSHALFKMVRG